MLDGKIAIILVALSLDRPFGYRHLEAGTQVGHPSPWETAVDSQCVGEVEGVFR